MGNIDLIGSAEAARTLKMPIASFNRRVIAGLIPTVGRLPGKTGPYLFDSKVIDQLAKDNSNENAK